MSKQDSTSTFRFKMMQHVSCSLLPSHAMFHVVPAQCARREHNTLCNASGRPPVRLLTRFRSQNSMMCRSRIALRLSPQRASSLTIPSHKRASVTFFYRRQMQLPQNQINKSTHYPYPVANQTAAGKINKIQLEPMSNFEHGELRPCREAQMHRSRPGKSYKS